MNHQSRNTHAPPNRSYRGLGLTGEGEQEIEACKALWGAVLRAAAHDAWFGSNDKKSRIRHQAQAVSWFASDNEDAGSCIWICQVLGMDINAVRQRVGA